MINFSWKKVNDNLAWNPFAVLEYFYLKSNIEIPTFLKRKVPEIVKRAVKLPYPSGPCYILNIHEALENTTDPNHLYVYLELASKRNKFDYAIRGVKYLPCIMVEDYLLEWVERNPMLKVENNNIYFKYEQE